MGLLVGTRRALLGGAKKMTYIDKVLSYSPTAYWPLWEVGGGVAECLVNPAQNGTYVGVSLGDDTAPDGSPCPLFDGTSDYVNIFSATLDAAFSGAEGTLIAFVKVRNAGVWIDGATRQSAVLRADANNRAYAFHRGPTNNEIVWRYTAGGVDELILEGGHSEEVWLPIGATWSKSAGIDGEFRGYIDGAQPVATATALGVWVGALGATTTVIGARSTTPDDPWNGWISHVVYWNSALPPATMLALAVV